MVFHKKQVNIKITTKIQQRETQCNVFTEEVNKIATSANDDKRIQLIDSTETYAHGASKDLVCKKVKTKCNKIQKR